MMLNRIKIIQRLIRATGAKNYLEIGVNNGACFLRLKAPYKMAVDPAFRIAAGRKLKYFVKNPANVNNHYHEQTSDDFFRTQCAVLEEHKPKVVFVDGLHTYEQALRDVLNSLKYLDHDGVILMHDCNPLTEVAAYPAKSIDHAKRSLPDYEGVWNGDVWKAIVHLRSLHADLEVFVLDCDHGIGVVRRGIPADRLNYSAEEIMNLSYVHLEADRVRLLNLKSPDSFDGFADQVRSQQAVSGV
jgi:hypothetical protein